jgi:hypothetical protein
MLAVYFDFPGNSFHDLSIKHRAPLWSITHPHLGKQIGLPVIEQQAARHFNKGNMQNARSRNVCFPSRGHDEHLKNGQHVQAV